MSESTTELIIEGEISTQSQLLPKNLRKAWFRDQDQSKT